MPKTADKAHLLPKINSIIIWICLIQLKKQIGCSKFLRKIPTFAYRRGKLQCFTWKTIAFNLSQLSSYYVFVRYNDTPLYNFRNFHFLPKIVFFSQISAKDSFFWTKIGFPTHILSTKLKLYFYQCKLEYRSIITK